MIKAAFFDIDGTLLSFKTHRVSEGTVRAFDRLHRAGVRTFLSTGRPMAIVPPMPLQFEAFVTMNGALVFTPELTLLRNPLPAADLDAWVDFAKRRGLCTMVFTENGMCCSQLNTVAARVRDQLEFPMPETADIDSLRGLTAYQVIAVMPASLDDEVAALMPSCRLPRWHPQFTDIVCGSNSKASGLEAVCRHFGIEREQTIAFGDGGNDIEMLRWAGVGVAMGNADDLVKQAADMVTDDVDHEGIEKAVEQLLSRQ
ncbi:MAG: Cof-type HAD-IIB family hydrolase [Bacteroidales bacterium]|nr:Cof-type HAD-IIB family hydrolase [Bacteroidales bacterium]